MMLNLDYTRASILVAIRKQTIVSRHSCWIRTHRSESVFESRYLETLRSLCLFYSRTDTPESCKYVNKHLSKKASFIIQYKQSS